jgi:hypothetical protein
LQVRCTKPSVNQPQMVGKQTVCSFLFSRRRLFSDGSSGKRSELVAKDASDVRRGPGPRLTPLAER